MKRIPGERFLVLALLLIVFRLGLLFGNIYWPKISIPFSNPHEVFGPLTLIQFNPTTNFVRYAFYVTLPTLMLIAVLIIPALRTRIVSIFDRFRWEDHVHLDEIHPSIKNKILSFSKLIVILFALQPVIRFLGSPFRPKDIEIFHAGEALTPAYNYLVSGEFWTKTFFVHGLFADPLHALLGWKLFGNVSIGSEWFVMSLLEALVLTAFFALVWSLKKIVPTDEWWHQLLAVQVVIAGAFLPEFFYQNSGFYARDIPVILGVASLICGFQSRKAIWFFVAGLLSVVSGLYSIDRGAYFTALLVLVCLALPVFPIENRKKSVSASAVCIVGILLGWGLAFILLGQAELSAFLADTATLFSTKELFDGRIYPAPGSFHSPHTFPLVLIAAQIFCFVLFFINDYRKKIETRTFGYIQFSFLLLAIFYFRYALGRYDEEHVIRGASFALFGTLFLAWLFVRRINNLFFYVAFIPALLLFNLYYTAATFFRLNPERLLTFPTRIAQFVKADDASFLSEREEKGTEELKKIFANEPCLFSLTSEAALPYLLRKPSCGKNFVIWYASAKERRQEIMRDLAQYQPELLLYKSQYWTNNIDSMSNEDRFPDVFAFVQERYEPYQTVLDDWQIYRKKP